MDIHIGDLHSIIVDREIEIIQELLDQILVHDKSMAQACDVCAELDCLLSFADASNMFNYQRPNMVEDDVIDITQGRCVTVPRSKKPSLTLRQTPLAGTGCRYIRSQ